MRAWQRNESWCHSPPLEASRTQLHVLRQFNHVAVEIFIASAATPRFRTWFVEDVSACTYSCCMSTFDVGNRQSDLCTGGWLPFCRIEGEMKVCPFPPGDFSVLSAYPSVVNLIVTGMEIKSERVSVECRRTFEIGNLQDDCYQPAVLDHFPSLARSSV